jgi:4'-phosphopantetheinyl transferase EntD
MEGALEARARDGIPQGCHDVNVAALGRQWQRDPIQVPIHSQFSHDLSPLAAPGLSPGLASLFPEGVVAAEMRAPGDASLLAPEEAAVMANAVPKRVGEFAAGRLCARRALAELGIADGPIMVAPDRTPIWPQGIVGSITHTEGMYAAVVAERKLLRGIGIDTEPACSVESALWPRILIRAELDWLASLERHERAAAATLIFSAKEAAYKCQYPSTGERLSFSDLNVTVVDWGAERGALHVAPTRAIALTRLMTPEIESFTCGALPGAYRRNDGFVSAGVFMPLDLAFSPVA